MPPRCRGTGTWLRNMFAVLEFLGDIRRFPAVFGSSPFPLLPLNATLKEERVIDLLASDPQSQGWI